MLLMGSTANLDTGIRNGKWHTFCASRFFIFTLFAQIYNTVLCGIVYSKIKTISRTNLYVKYVLVLSYFVQLYISLKYGEDLWSEDRSGLNSVVGKILEWTLTFCVVGMFYSMGADCQHFEFVFEESKSSLHT